MDFAGRPSVQGDQLTFGEGMAASALKLGERSHNVFKLLQPLRSEKTSANAPKPRYNPTDGCTNKT